MPSSAARLRLLSLVAVAALLLPGPAVAAPSAAPPFPNLAGGATVSSFYGPHLSACGSVETGIITTTSASLTGLLICGLTVSRPGRVLVLATASVAASNSTHSYEANFRLADNATLFSGGLPFTARYVDVAPDSAVLSGGDGIDTNLSITAFLTVTPGTNYFVLLGRRTAGTGTVTLYYPSLTAIYLPDSETELLMRGANSAGIYRAYTSAYAPTVGCTLNLPRPGLVYVTADGWMGLDSPANGPYEARATIGLDNQTNVGGIRFTDVTTDTANGRDVTLAATHVFSVGAGLHEFKLFFSLLDGDDPARMAGASLAALYVPIDSGIAQVCYQNSASEWENSTTTNANIVSCTVEAPRDSWAFISATGSTGLAVPPDDDAYEGQFGIGLDSLVSLSNSHRYVNSYPNSGDGVDQNVAVSLLRPLTEGNHTIRFVGRRRSTPASVALVRYPSLFVLVPGAPVFLPGIQR